MEKRRETPTANDYPGCDYAVAINLRLSLSTYQSAYLVKRRTLGFLTSTLLRFP